MAKNVPKLEITDADLENLGLLLEEMGEKFPDEEEEEDLDEMEGRIRQIRKAG